jgi:hypothetical protein
MIIEAAGAPAGAGVIEMGCRDEPKGKIFGEGLEK